jgi:hypothetical protein
MGNTKVIAAVYGPREVPFKALTLSLCLRCLVCKISTFSSYFYEIFLITNDICSLAGPK